MIADQFKPHKCGMKFLLFVEKEGEKAHETREDVVRDEVWIKSGDVRLQAIIRDPNGDTGSCQSSVHVCVHACVCQ